MDNYVTNPHTGRLIKKGSKVHKRLMNQAPVEPTKDVGQPKVQPTKKIIPPRQPTREETINKVTDIAVESIRQHNEALAEREMTDEEMDKYIRKMITDKLASKPTRGSLKDRLNQKVMKQHKVSKDEDLSDIEDFESYFE